MKSFVGKKGYLTLALLLLQSPLALANPMAHYFRATPKWYEPNQIRPWATTFEVTVHGGSTTEGLIQDPTECDRDKTVNAFEIYGLTSLLTICNNVPSNPASFGGGLLAALKAAIPNDPATFAKLKFDKGKFKLIETTIDWQQHLGKKGFFWQINIPIRRLEIEGVGFTDQTSTLDAANAHLVNPVIDNFSTILAEFNLTFGDFKSTDIGDTSLMFGWSYNSCGFDTTIRVGLLVPTGIKRNEDVVFSIASGHNGHFGGIASHESALKLFNDTLEIGAHLNVTFFSTEHRDIRMKSAVGQTGPIKFGKGHAQIEQAPVWSAGTHVAFNPGGAFTGIALAVGYSYAKHGRDKITPDNVILFPPDLVNDDEQYAGWQMHTINIAGSYQFGSDCSFFRPRLTAFYNRQIKGFRTFNTHTGGGSFGFDLMWEV